MATYHLTVRNQSEGSRQQFDNLDDAMHVLEEWVTSIIEDGALEKVSAIREFGPDQRVKARLQLGTGGLFRGKAAGIDIMGDLRCVPHQGGIKRIFLRPENNESPLELVRQVMAGER